MSTRSLFFKMSSVSLFAVILFNSSICRVIILALFALFNSFPVVSLPPQIPVQILISTISLIRWNSTLWISTSFILESLMLAQASQHNVNSFVRTESAYAVMKAIIKSLLALFNCTRNKSSEKYQLLIKNPIQS